MHGSHKQRGYYSVILYLATLRIGNKNNTARAIVTSIKVTAQSLDYFSGKNILF